jgi:hypothetical protein
MYPVIALVGLATFTRVVAIWATFDKSEINQYGEKPEASSPDRPDQQKAA